MEKANEVQQVVARPSRRRWWRRWWFWAAVVVVLIIAYGQVQAALRGKVSTALTERVSRQSLTRTVEAAGTVESTQSLSLAFPVSGQLGSLPVAEGQAVEPQALLASLVARQEEAQLAQAEAAVRAAEADLAKVRAGASAEAQAVAAERVRQAEVQLAAAQSALASLEAAQADDVSNWRTSLQQTITAKVFVGTRAADVVHEILTDDEARPLFFQRDNTNLSRLDSLDAGVHGRLAAAGAAAAQLSVTDDAALTAAASSLIGVLNEVSSLLDGTFGLLSEITATVNFTDAELAAMKTSVTTERTNTSAAVAAVQAASGSLVNGQASYRTQVDAAESAVVSARAAFDLAVAQRAESVAPARPFELSAAEARVGQARADLQRAAANLENYRLRAPIAGKVVRSDFRVGENVPAGTAVVSLLGTVPFQVKVKVAEADIADVAVSQPVKITLDAFGDGRPFAGTVTAVDLAETLVDKVVYYEVTVTFTDDVAEVKLGMSADVYITTATRQDVLVVPQRAVRSDGDRRYVVVELAPGQTEERTVSLGLRGDDGLVEVLTGLNEGDAVVVLDRKDGAAS